ncbi:MAG: hypothetical protein IPH88_19360 [Bacteroidales bacterium]|nr:hypothetical protein [Bacteroidales bacterium]
MAGQPKYLFSQIDDTCTCYHNMSNLAKEFPIDSTADTVVRIYEVARYPNYYITLIELLNCKNEWKSFYKHLYITTVDRSSQTRAIYPKFGYDSLFSELYKNNFYDLKTKKGDYTYIVLYEVDGFPVPLIRPENGAEYIVSIRIKSKIINTYYFYSPEYFYKTMQSVGMKDERLMGFH